MRTLVHSLALLAILDLLGVLGTVAQAEPEDPDGARIATAATWLSVGATAAGYATMGLAVAAADRDERPSLVAMTFGGTAALLGPSLGRVYGGNVTASGGLYLRLGALPVAVIGMFVIAAECAELEPCPGHPGGNVVLGTAAAMLVGGTIWELVTVGDEARRHLLPRRSSTAIVPQVTTTGLGLAVAGRF